MSMVRRKLSRRGVDVAAGQLVLVGKADGVDEEVELAPLLFERREDGIDGWP